MIRMDVNAKIWELEDLIGSEKPETIDDFFHIVEERYDDIYMGIVAKYSAHFTSIIERVNSEI